MNPVKLKFKEWLKRVDMWKHRATYEIHQNPDSLILLVLVFMFFIHLLIFVGLSLP